MGCRPLVRTSARHLRAAQKVAIIQLKFGVHRGNPGQSHLSGPLIPTGLLSPLDADTKNWSRFSRSGNTGFRNYVGNEIASYLQYSLYAWAYWVGCPSDANRKAH